jgi:hypothetical protein
MLPPREADLWFGSKPRHRDGFSSTLAACLALLIAGGGCVGFIVFILVVAAPSAGAAGGCGGG